MDSGAANFGRRGGDWNRPIHGDRSSPLLLLHLPDDAEAGIAEGVPGFAVAFGGTATG